MGYLAGVHLLNRTVNFTGALGGKSIAETEKSRKRNLHDTVKIYSMM